MIRSLRGVINYSKQLYVPYIQQWNANPMADIFPSILSGSIPTHLLPLYKALGEPIVLFSSQIFKSFRESQRPVS